MPPYRAVALAVVSGWRSCAAWNADADVLGYLSRSSGMPFGEY